MDFFRCLQTLWPLKTDLGGFFPQHDITNHDAKSRTDEQSPCWAEQCETDAEIHCLLHNLTVWFFRGDDVRTKIRSDHLHKPLQTVCLKDVIIEPNLICQQEPQPEQSVSHDLIVQPSLHSLQASFVSTTRFYLLACVFPFLS